MRIKTKLTLGVGLLFILIILLGSVGASYIHSLKKDTENILHDNYNSLLYAKTMLQTLDAQTDQALARFEEQLIKQENNATEQGEIDINAQIRHDFEAYRHDPLNLERLKTIRISVVQLMEMNMQAIETKSQYAETTAYQATIWIAITGTACFVIAFTLLINLPSSIADPIQKLTLSIKQIAANNYGERVHFEKSDEFGELAQSFNTMAQKLEEYNSSHLAKLMRQKKRIETLINKMIDPVIGLDENMQVIFVNEEACKVTGLLEDQMVGKSSKDLALGNDLIRLLLHDMQQKTPTNEPIKIVVDDKEGYYTKEFVHIEITPTGEATKEVVGHVIILRNITEYKELDFAKTRFIATVSHEFKTPISSMKMSLQLLKNKQIGALNEEQNHLVDSVHDDVNRLLKITTELLNMTQVESGNIQLNVEPCLPQKILDYALEANRTSADLKEIDLQVHQSPIAHSVLADVEKTAWVLTNLIANAINYSHDNSVIKIALEQTHMFTQITVKDDGIGIPPEYIHRVFDRYFRVPGTHREGTGLGLAISKEFIDAQGGTISVKSDYGTGSEFTIELKNKQG